MIIIYYCPAEVSNNFGRQVVGGSFYGGLATPRGLEKPQALALGTVVYYLFPRNHTSDTSSSNSTFSRHHYHLLCKFNSSTSPTHPPHPLEGNRNPSIPGKLSSDPRRAAGGNRTDSRNLTLADAREKTKWPPDRQSMTKYNETVVGGGEWRGKAGFEKPFLPYVIGITPTYYRLTQRLDLTSLCQTLMNVPRFLWIVVEDSNTTSQQVRDILSRCEVSVRLCISVCLNLCVQINVF